MIAQVNPADAARILKEDPDATYLDVRTVEEFQAGHPAGAWNLPVAFFDAARRPVPNPDFEKVVQAVVPKEKKVIVGCQSGMRSAKAAEILERLGYRSVANMTGGFGGGRDAAGQPAPGWRDSGLPVEPGNPAGRGWDDLRRKA